MKKLMLVAVGAVLGLSALAESFYTKNYKSSTCVWRDFDNWENWGIWSDGETGENPDHLVPGENDWINAGNVEYGHAYNWFDLGGTTWTIQGLEDGYVDTTQHYRWWNLTNGTLNVTSTWSNRSAYVTQHAGMKMILAATSHSCLGSLGQELTHTIKEGAELQILGTLEQGRCRFLVHPGGKLVFDPVFFGGATNLFKNGCQPAINNEGLVTMPHGLTFQGSGPDYDGYQRFTQTNGVLEIGGPVVHASPKSRLEMYFYGGTIHATGGLTFGSSKNTGLMKYKVMKNAALTVNVDEAASVDFKNVTFEDNVVLTKEGTGLMKFDASAPSSVIVASGAEYPVAAKTALGSWLTLAPNSTLVLTGTGVTADAIAGITDESVTVKLDSACPSGKLISSDSADLLATILAKLSASSSARGSFVAENGAIYFEKPHEETIFSWKNQGTISNSEVFDLAKWSYKFYPFFESTSWAEGKSKSGTNPDGLIPGTDDWMYYGDDYGPIFAMDMEGRTGTIGGFDSGFTTLEPWGFRGVLVKNGTLRISQCFSGTRFTAHAIDGGTILHDTTAVTQTGRGEAQCYWIAEAGGTIDLKGEIDFVAMQSVCRAGGTFNLDLDVFAMHKDCNGSCPETYFKNYGTFNMPHGLALTGTGNSSSWGRVHLYQYDGVMPLGGDVSVASTVYGNIFLHLHGGTLKITDDVAFSRIHYLGVEEGCTVTLDVDADKTVNFASLDLGLQFGADAKLVKTGAGAMTLGNTLAGQLEVQGGTVRCQQTALGDKLMLAAGGTLVLTGSGVSATAINGLDVGQIAIADTINFSKVFTSSNAELLDAVLSKLGSSIAPEDSVFKVGNAIYFERAHSSAVYSWVPVVNYIDGVGNWYRNTGSVTNLPHYSFLQPSNWSLGRTRTGGNPDGVIPQADDDIYIDNTYEPLFTMDLQGQMRTLRNYDKTEYKEMWGFNGFSIKNGSLEFTGTFKSTRGYLFVSEGGKLIFGPTSTSIFGSGGAECMSFVYENGEIVYQGDVTFTAMLAKIYAGGKMTIDPTDGNLKCPYGGYTYPDYIDVDGTLALPHGLTLTGTGGNGRVWSLTLREGSTLELGGPLVRQTGLYGTYSFQLEGGSLTVTENAAITGFNSVTMADEASVEIDIAEGKTLDLSSMTFGSNTTVTNTGKGRIRFGASRPTTYINPNAQPAMIILW